MVHAHLNPITDDTDYIPVSTVLTYQPSSFGEPIVQCTSIGITNDSIQESTENFFVRLQTSDVAVNLTPGIAAVTVLDDDGMQMQTYASAVPIYHPLLLHPAVVVVGFQMDTYAVLEVMRTVTVCATLIGQTQRTIPVNISTLNSRGTAEGTCIHAGNYTFKSVNTAPFSDPQLRPTLHPFHLVHSWCLSLQGHCVSTSLYKMIRFWRMRKSSLWNLPQTTYKLFFPALYPMLPSWIMMVSHRPCEYNYAVNSSNIYNATTAEYT